MNRASPRSPRALLPLILLAACQSIPTVDQGTPDNPLLAPWTGAYGGVPAFDSMDLGSLRPALEVAMAEHLAEIEAISGNPAAPTFDNTIVAMERAGSTLDRVMTYYGIWSSNLSSPEFRAIQGEMAPALAAHRSKITQNAALFGRIRAVHDAPSTQDLPADAQRLVDLVYKSFAKNGATLEGEAKGRYAAIQARLAELYTKFSNNVLADEEGYVLFLDENQLGGLPADFVAAAGRAAADRDQPGRYAITNSRSSMDPFLTFSSERTLREKVWRTYYSRAGNGDAHDNHAVIAEILRLRDERVALLGFDNYAAWQLQDRMAQEPARVRELLESVWKASTARVAEEVADMQQLAKAEGADIQIAPWDYRYYAEKVRRARYALDSGEVKQYLQLTKLRDAMFYVAGEVFGFEFTPVPAGTVPTFHPDVEVFEVTQRDGGAHVGLFYLDPFARQGKRSGAWATTYRSHRSFDGEETVLAANNSNFVAGSPGEPTLISWDDATTLFHEFGHGLHYLTSACAYPSLNGGVRDFIEFQSQLLERWLLSDRVIEKFLVHHETGKPMPAELIAKIRKASTFNQGFSTTEYLASALMDLAFHTADPEGLDPKAFEQTELERLGMPSELVMRHRTPHFAHVFAGEGYATGYYGYMWADVLTADAAEAFAEAEGGFFDAGVAASLVRNLFSPGNSVDPAVAYRAFRGRDARVDALMRDRGFAAPAGAGH
jgi:peptidyl-dipeptidase Dcp